ncbi:MAG: helix-turn-helix domain-containing protein [Bacilli bacterium]|nr:helix-turn-helix domain-containing protein [Bacilli bacterium]
MDNRYTLHPSTEDKSTMICVDTKTGFTIEYKIGKFNDTQECTVMGYDTVTSVLEQINDMTQWLLSKFDKSMWLLDEKFYIKQVRTAVSTLISENRAKMGLSVHEVAAASGISANNLSNIENGKYSVSVEILNRIATVLNFTIPIGGK